LSPSESDKEPINVFSLLDQSIHVSKESLPFGGGKNGPTSEHFTKVSEIERNKHGELGHIDVHVAVFIGGSPVTSKMDWSISQEIIVIFGFSISGKIGHEEISLLDQIKSGQEAV
jgi:hypothetical protein